jgi:hypothetical protein
LAAISLLKAELQFGQHMPFARVKSETVFPPHPA